MAEITSESGGGFLTTFTAGKHTFIADEPVTAGGEDKGPTPYDYLAAALAGCTSMTLHFYARREQIPLEAVKLKITHDRAHAADCADCVTKAGFIHRFVVKIALRGNLTEEQRQKLLGVARRCPVYKTLTSEIRIDEELESAAT